MAGLWPAGVVTLTSTVPVPVGLVAWIRLSLPVPVKKLLAGVEPKLTALAPLKLWPLMYTVVPAGAVEGLTAVTAGSGGVALVYV